MKRVPETSFKDHFTNPFIFLSILPALLLFNKYMPNKIRQIVNDFYATANRTNKDPLESFVFNPAPVAEA